MIIWRLEIETQSGNWKHTENYFFKTKDEAEAFRDYKISRKENDSYIPNNCSIKYYFEENDFNNLKNKMTIADYEALFNTKLKPNGKLSVDDLETGMTVWNETQGEYQRVRYISTHDLKDYHWCDGWGNDIESDELYNYKLN